MSAALLSLRCGLVGTGRAARHRAEALKASGEATLVAVASRDPARAAAFAAAQGAEAAGSWEALVARTDLEAVLVSTVNPLHAPVALAALSAGKHVAVEYPLALTLADCDTLLDAAARADRFLHVGHLELLTAAHLALRERRLALGPILHAEVVSLQPREPAPGAWTFSRETFGPPLVGAVSRLARLLDLCGEVAWVEGTCREEPAPEAYRTVLATATLGFAAGGIGHVLYGKGEGIPAAVHLTRLVGTQGGLEASGGRLIQRTGDRTEEVALPPAAGLFARDTLIFLDGIRRASRPTFPAARAREAVAVALAADRAAREGRRLLL